ncbi:MAG: cupin domain-containing protein [Candidatus Hydrogenedentota bacterium]|nr:MAG: cupin domain-containing protein [Candidatus Hydrogenedentota bacterium]
MDESTVNVGKRIRSFRDRSGLSLRQLAGESGLAFTTIQKIETSSISPALGILMKIARGLNVSITTLLEEEPETRTIHFIRKGERIGIESHRQNIRVEYIAQTLINPEMVGFHLMVEPGERSGPEPLLHAGEEIAVGVQGTIEFVVGEERHVVNPGDCLHFKSDIPHRWRNPGRKPARFYLVCSESHRTLTPPDQV